jgi:tetratricopeptide (TPR) repeat protein
MMSKGQWFCAMVVAAAMSGAAECRGAAPAPPAPAAIELAERLESLAYGDTDSPNAIPAAWREAEALLKAAARLNPAEPRFTRMLYQACIGAEDSSGAQAALLSYLTAVPDDQYAQAKLIDLYLARMQTAESMLNYMRSLVGKTALPGPVRAHAAVICAQTLLERSQRDEALKMLNTALQIDPLCISALRIKLNLTGDEGPSRRCGLLLAILRANPLDADAATTLADQLALLGLPEASAIWYAQAATIYQYTNQPRSQQLGKGASTELYLCDHGSDAQQLLDIYLNSVPDDADAWTIRLAIAEDTPSGESAYQALTHRAVNAALHALQSIRAAMGDENAEADAAAAAAAPAATQPAPLAGSTPPPTTQPLDPTPDMSDDMRLLVRADQRQLTDDYINAVGNLAWIRLYFLRDAGEETQRVIDVLAGLLRPDDPLLARLTGWSYLVRGQWPEARQKLGAVADRDAYAAMGMVYVLDQAGNRAGGDLLAQRLLALHPSGPLAAVLFSAFHGRGAKIIPMPQADAVTAAVQAFPRDWLNIFTQPQEFYTVTAEPLEREVVFPQAILARITIQNVGDYDITMGDQGTLRPQMVFDAVMRGLVDKQIGQTAYDQFWQRLVLAKGQFASQIVRLDRGDLLTQLTQQPDVPIDVQFSVIFNPIAGDQGYVVGPAGCRAPFIAMSERSATSIDTADERKKLYDLLSKGRPEQRMRAVTAAGTFYGRLRTAAAGITINQSVAMAKEMFDHTLAASSDADPMVQAWARYYAIAISPPDRQADLVQQLAQSDAWYGRLLAVIAAEKSLPDGGAVAAGALSGDPDPVVRDYASAVSDKIRAAAASQNPGQ